ncbi:antitoxin Xre/MbcA/ParS toxin-binding domain-containing protein [Stenotrophomonas sp. NRRL B-14846]|uniref:antitoxin Xre/MbcA/ParS toxin-binding domain-containing protein n=1 Tax=Stenotrophomonas sp. NRRL B-14846 TaxID=3162882 RepID=UPI003D279DB7
MIGIYRALRTIFPNRQQANAWIRRANAAAPFKGDTAVALMCSGGVAGLSTVRQYLEAGGTVDA